MTQALHREYARRASAERVKASDEQRAMEVKLRAAFDKELSAERERHEQSLARVLATGKHSEKLQAQIGESERQVRDLQITTTRLSTSLPNPLFFHTRVCTDFDVNLNVMRAAEDKKNLEQRLKELSDTLDNYRAQIARVEEQRTKIDQER